jgi:CDP-glycerol glycerophosphotransferase
MNNKINLNVDKDLKLENKILQATLKSTEKRVIELQKQNLKLQQKYDRVVKSLPWRITKPFRFLKKKLKKIPLKKLRRKIHDLRIRFLYTKYYENEKIKTNNILVQCYAGNNFSGNVYYMVMDLLKNNKYGNFNVFVATTKEDLVATKKNFRHKSMKKIKFIIIGSSEYCRLLANSKYLINNASFPPYFIKKEGQIYINPWHGTPLKGLGRSIKDAPNEIGNHQRNFMMADFLLYPNYYTFENMKRDYMLDNIFNGKYIISGYPRNSIFFDSQARNSLKKDLDLKNKEIIVYMPTWRRNTSKEKYDYHYGKIMSLLKNLDKNLKDNQVLYVKLHNLMESTLDYENFKRIKPFPNGYETYEILNLADCLITDYSSVFFDFANTRKKIVLYAYDLKEYMDGRSIYFNLEDLPFPIVDNEIDLLNEVKNVNKFTMYNDFIKKFCSYDSINNTSKLLNYIFQNKVERLEVIGSGKYKNNKENVLIYAGGLNNCMTTSTLFEIIDNIDLEKRNYYLTFYKTRVERHKLKINDLSEKINYLTIQGSANWLFSEFVSYLLYYKFGFSNKYINKKLDKAYTREAKRLYCHINFSHVVHYAGKSTSILNLFAHIKGRKHLFVSHSKFTNSYIRSFKLYNQKYDEIITMNNQVVNKLKKCDHKLNSSKVYNLSNKDNAVADFEKMLSQ